ncbi:MAG: DUF2169 domain-containing protein [Myxococcales bacterium]|nr:DUF2169 domain-containing protein [Myxococcales bacterium]
MPHPDFDNRTAFFADALHLIDERLAPLLTVVIKGTFDILPGGCLALRAEQPPLELVGLLQDPEAEQSSHRYEPEIAPFKVATDVVFVGHAHAPHPRTMRMDVGLHVGPVSRSLRVFGDRVWVRALGASVLTQPLPFERIPVVYERAFGGWDTSATDPRRHAFEPRNPVGRGYHHRRGKRRARVLAPNLEAIEHPIRSPHDTPPPACLGFVSPHWQPRVALAGTHDAAWREHEFPRLPADFDRRHHNAASPGLVAPGHLRGDERVQTVGLSPEGTLGFTLPGIPPPAVRVSLAQAVDHRLSAVLDTLVVDLDDRRLTMLWRACLPLPEGPHDVRAIEVTCSASLALPRSDTVSPSAYAANQPSSRGPRACPSP